MTSDNLKSYLVVAGAIVLLTLGVYGYIQLRSENRALQRSLEVHKVNYARERDELTTTSLSLQSAVDSLRLIDEVYKLDIEELRARRVVIDQTHQDEKDRINSYTADSLERYFARRYGADTRE